MMTIMIMVMVMLGGTENDNETLYWNVPYWGHQLLDINCRMCVCVCVRACVRACVRVCVRACVRACVRRHVAKLRQE